MCCACFERTLFRGYLPIMAGLSMPQLFKAREIDSRSVKPFMPANAERVNAHAVALAGMHGRPFEYRVASVRHLRLARHHGRP